MWRMVTIGGIDPSGGAGVELDVKVGEAFDVHVHPIATMITYQTPTEYYGGQCLDVSTIVRQIQPYTMLKYWKTGALCNEEILRTILDLSIKNNNHLIVDPVLKAGVGGTLFDGDPNAYRDLLSHAFAVTPNIPEAEILTNVKVKDEDDMLRVAQRLSEMGPELVVLTGGHLGDSKLVDVIYYKGNYALLHGSKVNINLHGSGSALASALTALLAKGEDPFIAARKAIGFTRLLHKFARDVGGYVPDPLFSHRLAIARFECHERYRAFIKWLESLPYEKAKKIAPEVGLNVACSVPKEVSRSVGTVMGVPGRLHLTPNGLRRLECPWWGGSDHMARLLLSARKYGEVNVAMNVRYSKENIQALKEAGYLVVEVDRSKQPRGVKTMGWVVEEAVKKTGRLPDVIYDRGYYGKEAMIRLLAKDLCDLKQMVLAILNY
ncbi:hypothetical protein IPA_09765 [Ignicoccus pacificus DSM 13166]|uniref:Pyridoxamine kinase/Phosphomethylpyrimidine kinase domain-containing protein n=1 Tax=Ignicoccus pacificus DSM 13166 TaxID=940294 RepID=A0A977KC53_9CREN|nr:hypothetical protein IPA_09765 [Ignicoccus pacificus DSM 13166]